MAEPFAAPETEALEVIAGLVPEFDDEWELGSSQFYDRLCEAVCRLASMRRAGLLLYDDARKLVVPVGSHGVDASTMAQIYGTLDETPIAQRALAEDRVVEVAGLEGEVPERYVGFEGFSTMTCTPVSAAGHWLGVIFADRAGEPFELTEFERQTMMAIGKAAALAASARIGVTQQVRARIFATRLDLARDLHERVVQRLFGVSLALGSERPLGREELDRCAEEIQHALADLRDAVSRPLTPPPLDTGATLAEELERLGRYYSRLPIEVHWEPGAEVPAGLEPLAQSVLAEALRNCAKHAEPTWVEVNVGTDGATFHLEVSNDGVKGSERMLATGMGLRLAALDALQSGGMVEFGEPEPGRWRVRLVVPQGERGDG
ncbi:MAG: GAF domain-containing protein [Solirubrobacterales bacterium]